jgi:hypothetical protein
MTSNFQLRVVSFLITMFLRIKEENSDIVKKKHTIKSDLFYAGSHAKSLILFSRPWTHTSMRSLNAKDI